MPTTLSRRTALAGGAALLAAPLPCRTAKAQSAGQALVIGNSKYRWESSLPNARRDAIDVARRLGELGLKTVLLQDCGRAAMSDAIERFNAAARGAALAAFYFAGHGLSWENGAYLVPEDVDLADPASVKLLIPVTALHADGAERRLMIFDSCRNNPADGWRQREAMLAAGYGGRTAEPKPDTLHIYSTAPGRVALDGPAGDNSPFASALLRQLARPPVDLRQLPAGLRRDLLLSTGGRQVVWAPTNTFDGSYLLGRGSAGARAGVGAAIDPARIVELPQAYKYALSPGLNLRLLDGLVAIRPPAGSPHAEKVGSYRFDARNGVPVLAIVLSADEKKADVMLSSARGYRLFTGTFAAPDRLVLSTISVQNSAMNTIQFTWKDGNSGGIMVPGNPVFNGRFARLD